MFDQKAISPGGCIYGNNLFGILPTISAIDAENLANEGYRNMLQNVIKSFKEGTHKWVKQGELFILGILDKVAAFPVALYHLDKSGDHSDVERLALEILLYHHALIV